ncbi:MAG: TIGR03618 family F420-dependent PPOX class oxidoreductase [Chloroflexota bacterium]
MQTLSEELTAVRFSAPMREFLDEVQPAIIGTTRADGTIQMNPIWYERRDDEIWINGTGSRKWGQRLAANTPVTLIMVSPANMWRWAQIQGVVLEKSYDGGEAHIDRLSQRYLGTQYRNHQPDDPRLVLRIEPIRITGTIDAE